MKRAADWLVQTQDSDGCWRRWPTPFAAPGEKVYETHVALGLFRAAMLVPDRGYAEAAQRQVNWALGFQQKNGWLSNCCLSRATAPLTHTIGYALRGLVEAYLFTKDPPLLEACTRTADGVLRAVSQTDACRDGWMQIGKGPCHGCASPVQRKLPKAFFCYRILQTLRRI